MPFPGVSFSLQALNSRLMVKASLDTTQTDATWMGSSFPAASWSDVGLTGVALVCGELASVLAFGDHLATGLGAPSTAGAPSCSRATSRARLRSRSF